MKKKINIQMLVMVGIAIILTAILSIAVFYEVFKREMADSLARYTRLLSNTIENYEVNNIKTLLSGENGILENEKNNGIRVSIIDKKGNVVYDNYYETSKLQDHSDRPEIEQAFKDGEGQQIRQSDTMGKDIFYYAVRMDNGMVVRVAKEASSLLSIFRSAFPILGIVLVLTFAACFILTHYLAKSLITPIEGVANNMDHIENVRIYKELEPFVTTIKQQHEDILKSAMMRQEFTANVTHELKTPLTSISGYAELIENGMAQGEDVERFATEIHRNAKRLLSLINDTLRLSELDSNDGDLLMEDVNLYDIASNCVNMLTLHAGENDVKFHLKGSGTHVKGSHSMIEELVYNLCDNAIRYNREGGNIWVVVDPEDHSILVSDDGIGISEENQPRIFERFYRVDKSRSRKTGSTGLGLAIVKHIAEQHGAKIELTSAENVGTTIKVIFPDPDK